MLKKTLIAAVALSFIALGAASPASAHDRDWNRGKNWENYGYNDYGYNDYRYIRKPDHYRYGYWKYRPYPWWLQYNYWQPRWY
jgi:hypothetical protein